MKRSFHADMGLGFIIILAGLCVPLVCHAGGQVAAWGDNNLGQRQPPNGLNNVKSVAAGVFHSLALRADGTLAGWGHNDHGQASIPAGLSSVTSIAAGYEYSLALKADGTVTAWGFNGYGQTNLPSGLSNITAIAAGFYHSMALKSDGTVVVWHDDAGNQPTFPGGIGILDAPLGLSNVTAIAASQYNCLALRADGTVVAWGNNSVGQTDIPPGLSNVTAIAAGGHYHVALKADGTVVAWGYGAQGQTSVPPGLSNVKTIAAGESHTLALKADGTVIGWGFSRHGQADVPPGLSNVTAIAAGRFHSLLVASGGSIQILQNPQSQSLLYTSNATFSVVATGAGTLSFQWFRNGAAIGNGNRVSGANGDTLTIANLQFADTGTYTVVVSNAFGSVISDGATLSVISPPSITAQSFTNLTVRAGTDVAVSATADGTAPLRYQWSLNGTNLPGKTFPAFSLFNVQPGASGLYSVLVTNLYGSAQGFLSLTVTDAPPFILQQPFVRLPDQSTTTNPVVPIGGSVTVNVGSRGSLPLIYQWRFEGADIPGATNATLTLTNVRYDQTGHYSVAVRNAFGEAISAKVFLNVVQVYVWGELAFSGLGIYTPINVPPGLTNAVAVAAGNYHLLALKADGRVATWASFPVPTALTNIPSTVTNATAIAAASDNNMVLRADGKVIVWGNTSFGQTNVPPAVSNVAAIATGGSHCLALRSNGTVIGWGNNSYGQAAPAVGLSNVIAIAAGGAHSLALKTDGTVVGWGYNAQGQTNPPAGLSNVFAIDAAGAISLALKADGTAVSWGDPYGRVPTSVTNLVATGVGYIRNVGLKSDGSIVSWVSNQKPGSPALSNVIAVTSGERGSFSAAIIGNGSPFFTVHPASQTVTNGATVQFHARTAGVQPMSYQWQLDSVDIPGGTNVSLSVTNVRGKDTGGYRAVVANALGTAISRIATLTTPFSTNLPAALNATNLIWDTWSYTNLVTQIMNRQSGRWFAQNREAHDGEAAAQSGAVSHNQRSVLQTTVTGPGTLTFWWKVSSEQSYDFLSFYMNNLNTPQANISGETGWEQRTFAIAASTHTLRWTYAKDGTVSAGRDAGWLDEVVFTPAPPVIVRQPFGQTVWAGVNVTIPAFASSPTPMSYQWLKNGTNLPAADSQYLTLTNVTRHDSGIYTLRISNAGSSVTSSNAVLTVQVPQRLAAPTLQPDGGFVLSSRDGDGGQLLPDDLAGLEVQASTNLTDWVALPGALTLTNGSLLLRDPHAPGMSLRFYRVVEH